MVVMMVVLIALAVVVLVIATLLFLWWLVLKRDERQIMKEGLPFIAYILLTHDELYQPGNSYGATTRLLIAFEPESPELHEAMRLLVIRLLELRHREPQTEAERVAASLVNDHGFRIGRILLPLELTDGRKVYSHDGYIERSLLPAGRIDVSYIYCKAIPGEKGNILMIPYPTDGQECST